MICTSIQGKTLEEIFAILEEEAVEMAEIRLDRCPLTDSEIEELFSNTDTPLVATCRIAESAGKITSAEISKDPTSFIASTIITAVITAISRLYVPALTPVARAKLSSKVTANILL